MWVRAHRASFHPTGHQKVTGFDLDPIGIQWAQQHLPQGRFEISQEWPPLDIESSSIGFAYAISVFTHLDEEHATAWMEELQRVLKPGAIFLATFRGSSWIQRAVPDSPHRKALLKDVQNEGIVFRSTNVWAGVFPGFYQGTYHSYDYIIEQWSKFFYVASVMTAGQLDIAQDCAVLINRR